MNSLRIEQRALAKVIIAIVLGYRNGSWESYVYTLKYKVKRFGHDHHDEKDKYKVGKLRNKVNADSLNST